MVLTKKLKYCQVAAKPARWPRISNLNVGEGMEGERRRDRKRKGGEGMDGEVIVSVCLSVHLHISKSTRPNFRKFSVHVTCGRASVLL